MTRTEVLRALAIHARHSHTSALYVIGWFAAAASDEELTACLSAVHEAEAVLQPSGSLAAYAERYGLGGVGQSSE